MHPSQLTVIPSCDQDRSKNNLDINTTLIAPYLANADFSSYLDTVIPARQIGKPRDVAGAAVWLASGDESGYVNGIVLPIDGGFTAR